MIDAATLAALREFPRQLEVFFAAVPATHRNWSPASWDGVPSEPFSPIGQLCHVRDIEIDGYHLRFERALSETHPLLPSIDGDALAIERAYATADAAQVLADFRAAREKTVALIAGLDDRQLARTAEFEGYGPLTVSSLVHYLCSHDQQHLAGLQWLLGKMHAETAIAA
nr:DinB family protein [Cupriavidus gilardii]